ncbi:anti-sigma B factor RsbW [Lederbergia graminis]|uniref:Serine-protein kinase RsbW n=1 Tax=Lederbergia graminis TaxID=735518 RepID=A0ABW0LI09_9BACI
MKKACDYIEMKIPAMPEYIGVIRLTLSGIASRMGFTYDLIDDLKIAVSEAITNAVQHAYDEEEDGQILIGFSLYEDRLEVMVADSGASFNLEETLKEVGPYQDKSDIELMREGGLGLYLIESLMDEVKIHQSKGVTVFMTKFLEGEQVERDAEKIST